MMSLMDLLKHKVYPVVSRYFSHATLVEGKLRDRGDTFRCLFVENTNLMDYMLPSMFQGDPVVLRKWRMRTSSLKRVLGIYSPSIDMAIAVLPLRKEREFAGLARFRSQTLICSSIDVSCGWEDVRKRFQHNKRQFSNRMDRKPAFSCRVSRDRRDFDLFYNQMYVPHISRRFEDLAELDSYREMKDSFLKGLLLMIEEEEKTVAGVLCEVDGDTLLARRTGVLHGDEEYIRRGASSAEYYFMLRFALEQGLSRVDLLRSRPFLNDGVFSTKRKWGAAVYPYRESESCVLFFIPELTGKVAGFFEVSPLIVHREEGLWGLVGWSGEDPPSEKDRKQIREKYYSPGLRGLLVIGSHRPEPEEIRFDD